MDIRSPKRISDLLDQVRSVRCEEGVKALFQEMKAPSGVLTVAFINAHAVNMCWKCDKISADFSSVDILLRDGKGVEVLFKSIGKDPGLNLNGTDLIPEFLRSWKGSRISVYGTSEPWLLRACRKLALEGHEIISQIDGFKTESDYLADAIENEPQIILLAMGMPKQEKVARFLRENLVDCNITIICGGAIVDFFAGRFPRAPEWMRKRGLEWLFRFLQEPMRLCKRYLLGNVLFLSRIHKVKRVLNL
ncbi:hypothetical protein BVC71_02870 [Marivivens niveibacter]|uniref:Glycosyltransferase n=1 Tax=Marivivens niveibacter TaxID=1930667 RepID=A0A251X187_9RHOB|nr:WecB/TagA/CpsF family glycosyltransferase [Marivivens niveibacter]OUD10457.1 hypothetical protein BVC71_02870 [Marivivens niveibacter]